MGNGSYDTTTKKFAITVNFVGHDPQAEGIAAWEESFQLASRVLHDATFGQMQFGDIKFRINGAYTNADDDFYVENIDSLSFQAGANTDWATPLPNKCQAFIANAMKTYSFVITHEFGHFALTLGDEYVKETRVVDGVTQTKKTPSCCKTHTLYHACIMEFGRPFGAFIDPESGNVETTDKVNQFCSSDVSFHDGTTNTAQNERHGFEACWDTIVEKYPSTGKPMPNFTPQGEPLDNVNFDILNAQKQCLYTIVGEPELNGTALGNAIKNGGKFWANFLQGTEHRFGVISANPDPELTVPLQPMIGRDVNAITGQIDALIFQQSGKIVGAIELARGQHQEVPGISEYDAIVLVGPGTPPDIGPGNPGGGIPPGILGNLVRQRTYLHSTTISNGPVFESLDGHIASGWATLDPFHFDNKSVEQAITFQSQQIQLAFDVINGAEMIGYRSDQLPAGVGVQSSQAAEDDEGWEVVERLPFNYEPRFEGIDYPVLVAEGAERADFIASVLNSENVELEVIDPKGESLPESALVSKNHVGIDHYHWYRVGGPGDSPMPGRWLMRLRRKDSNDPVPFRLLAFSEHPQINVRFYVERPDPQDQKRIKLVARPAYERDLFYIEPPVVEVYKTDHQNTNQKHLVETIVLEPPTQRPPAASLETEAVRENEVHIASGEYVKEMTFDATDGPGEYTAVLRIANAGTAVHASNTGGTINGNLSSAPLVSIPNFVRFKQLSFRIR